MALNNCHMMKITLSFGWPGHIAAWLEWYISTSFKATLFACQSNTIKCLFNYESNFKL